MLIGLSGRDGRKNGTKTKNEKGTRNEMKRTNERTSRLKDGVERSFILKRGGWSPFKTNSADGVVGIRIGTRWSRNFREKVFN